MEKTDRGVSATTVEGRRFEYVLSGCGNPDEITDPSDRRLCLDITENGRHLHAIRIDDGQKNWTFDYDGMERQGQSLAQYHYQYHHLTAALDALGHAKRFYYRDGLMVRHMDKNKHSFYLNTQTAAEACMPGKGRTDLCK